MTSTLFQSSPPIKTNENVVTTLQISLHYLLRDPLPNSFPPLSNSFFPHPASMGDRERSNVIYGGLGLGLKNTTYLLLDTHKKAVSTQTGNSPTT